MTSPFRFRRYAAPLLAVLTVSCSFEPSVGKPGGGSRDAATDLSVPDANGTDDVGRGGSFDATIADVRVPDVAVPADATMSVDAVSTDVAPAPDTGPTPDAAPPEDMGSVPIICNGSPVDPQTDPDHCGRCNNGCDADHGACVAGTCVCELGATACGPSNVCTNTDYDSNDCGSCGNACDPGELCVGGTCVCRPGLRSCNGVCVDTESNPMHCGACNTACNGKACVDGMCENRNSCPIGTTQCDEPGGLACVRGRENDLHCDASFTDPCGEECAADQFCQDPGLFSGPECVTYRPAIGCGSCPCDDCEDEEACVETQDLPGVAFCVRR